MSDHERLPGRAEREWCPYCHGPSGSDCPGRYRSRRTTRRMNDLEVRRAWAQAEAEGK